MLAEKLCLDKQVGCLHDGIPYCILLVQLDMIHDNLISSYCCMHTDTYVTMCVWMYVVCKRVCV